MGNRASSRGGMFSIREIEYLESLPAVERVDNGRIRYTDDFKRECVKRYRAGESPSEIFRRSGLDVALIGYKRIERCVARWKNSARLNSGVQSGEATSRFDVAQPLRWVAPRQTRSTIGSNAALDDSNDMPVRCTCTRTGCADESRNLDGTGMGDSDGGEALDVGLLKLIVRQQARRIDELERELAQLREKKETDS